MDSGTYLLGTGFNSHKKQKLVNFSLGERGNKKFVNYSVSQRGRAITKIPFVSLNWFEHRLDKIMETKDYWSNQSKPKDSTHDTDKIIRQLNIILNHFIFRGVYFKLKL